MIRVLRDTFFSKMKFFSFLSLTFDFDIKFQYIITGNGGGGPPASSMMAQTHGQTNFVGTKVPPE